MAFSKVIPVGSAGALVLSEDAGVASISVSLKEALGQGALAGVASGSVSAQVSVSAKELIDAGLELIAAKFPSAAPLIEGLKSAIDAELAKV